MTTVAWFFVIFFVVFVIFLACRNMKHNSAKSLEERSFEEELWQELERQESWFWETKHRHMPIWLLERLLIDGLFNGLSEYGSDVSEPITPSDFVDLVCRVQNEWELEFVNIPEKNTIDEVKRALEEVDGADDRLQGFCDEVFVLRELVLEKIVYGERGVATEYLSEGQSILYWTGIVYGYFYKNRFGYMGRIEIELPKELLQKEWQSDVLRLVRAGIYKGVDIWTFMWTGL